MFLSLNKSQVEQFLYWIKERHNIHLRREANLPKPWTTDPILQQYFFTNPYRENDKVTRWWRACSDSIIAAVDQRSRLPAGAVIFATIAFRWFNYIPTGQVLLGTHLAEGQPQPKFLPNLLLHWDSNLARGRLLEMVARKQKVFTGAYIIKSPNGQDKVSGICDCIDTVWNDLDQLTRDLSPPGTNPLPPGCRRDHTLEAGWQRLLAYPYLGGFMAYEVISDLRHTPFFREASDVDTWANLGPGGVRGLRRCCDESAEGPLPSNSRALMLELHGLANYILCGEPFPDSPNWKSLKHPTTTLPHPPVSPAPKRGALGRKLAGPTMPHLEMREIEHSLCEFDKYCRARSGEGTMKRRYSGT